jgi:hypothetical protein
VSALFKTLGLLLPAGLCALLWTGSVAVPAEDAAGEKDPAYTTESLRGRVVWTADALRRRFGIETDPDAAKASVSLETPDGRLHPIVKDARGRGFFKDPRIRGIDVELFVRRYEGAPHIQVIRVYTLRDGRKYQFDYWCDICAIPMYELKECECCQGPIRIRERLVEGRP